MKRRITIGNLGCACCADKMEQRINELPLVESAKINFMSQKLVLEAAEIDFEEAVDQARKICDDVEPGCELQWGL